MTMDYLRSLAVAAAQLESAEFSRDQAASQLQMTVLEAISSGGSVTAVAEAAALSPETVFTLCDQADGAAKGLLVI
jgi:DNA-binding CsgD family transcriptional regulator